MGMLPARQGFSTFSGLRSPHCAFSDRIPHNRNNQRLLHAVWPSALPLPSKERTL
jgi:hypothetical protein